MRLRKPDTTPDAPVHGPDFAGEAQPDGGGSLDTDLVTRTVPQAAAPEARPHSETDHTGGGADSPVPPRGTSTAVLAAAALALVGLLVMALGGLSWWRASHDDDIAAAQTRDRAVVAASNEIATLNTLDYRDVDGGLRSWLAATTGTLHDQLAQAGSQDTRLLAEQKKVSTGKVVDAALTDLDAPGGTASVIASVEITVRGTSGQPTLKRNRFSANLVLVKGRWLLESLTQVPVDAS